MRNRSWEKAFREGVQTGSIASIVSTLALVACGAVENRRPAAPTNATSHWMTGEDGFRAERADGWHTLIGYLSHHGASVFWSTFYEKWFGGSHRPRSQILAEAALVASLGYVVDYRFMPMRLRPGWERHLSGGSLLLIYASFGLGMALRDLNKARTVRQRALKARHTPREVRRAWQARVQPAPTRSADKPAVRPQAAK